MIVSERQIRDDLLQYAGREVLLALLISFVTALLVFLSVYLVLVRPMRHITIAMLVLPPQSGRCLAHRGRLGAPGRDRPGRARARRHAARLYGFLQQKGRLAALGAAVAKIQHDLRNILASAQIASDRLSTIDDPVVQRLAPRLVASIDRAIALATNTLRYGRAEEHPPERRRFALRPLVEEAAMAAIAGQTLKTRGALRCRHRSRLQIDADSDQLFRIVLNLVRNAAEALAEKPDGEIRVLAERKARHIFIDVADNGPGIAESVRGQACSSLSPPPRARAAPAWASPSRAISPAPMAATSPWSKPAPAAPPSASIFLIGRRLNALGSENLSAFAAERTRPCQPNF